VITYGHHRALPIDIGNEKTLLACHYMYGRKEAAMKRQLMTAQQMMKHLQISKSTLRKYADKGLIGMWQPAGKNCAVRYYEIEEPVTCKSEPS